MEYRASLQGITEAHLSGFFVGWPNPPSPAVHLAILKGSHKISIAWSAEEERVVGFANAISDGVLSAFIPLLEVVPEHQGKGIGKALIAHLREQLDDLYMVDIVCDPDLEAFYKPLGFVPLLGMAHRNYENQSGPEV